MHLPLFISIYLLGAQLHCSGVTAKLTTGAQNTSNVVQLSYGSFQGQVTGNLAQFLGVPFAAPPQGQRRFGLPEPPLAFAGIRQAKAYSNSCPQQATSLPSGFPIDPSQVPSPRNASEDCLYLNVIRPANLPEGKPLPVIFWIYGGGYASGDSAANPGDPIVTRSLAVDEPVIFVSANYRLNVFGFLGGKEIQDAGLANLGLHDQRFALKWVQEHISRFGGDHRKVTIWGQSAGATSVSLHMLANEGDTEGLFIGGIMNSGSPYHLTTTASHQQWFNFIVNEVNCTSAQDRIQCLRDAPYKALVDAVNLTPGILDYQSLNIVWVPTIDGEFIIRDPILSIQKGKYAKIPVMTGDVEDEGSLFVFSSLNVTTTPQYLEYLKENFFPHASESDLHALSQAYPDNPAEGSPYNTDTENVKSPQSQRLASVLGDLLFQAPRRFFLRYTSRTQATYGFRFMRTTSISSSAPALPGLGIYHGFDLPEFFGVGGTPDFAGTDAIINFAHRGDPNAKQCNQPEGSKLCSISWPKWSPSQNLPLLTFVDAASELSITADTYREDAMDLLNRLWLNEVQQGI